MWILILTVAIGCWAVFFRMVGRQGVASEVVVLAYVAAAAFTAHGIHLVTGISYEGLSYTLLIGGLIWLAGELVRACWLVRANGRDQRSAELEGKE